MINLESMVDVSRAEDALFVRTLEVLDKLGLTQVSPHVGRLLHYDPVCSWVCLNQEIVEKLTLTNIDRTGLLEVRTKRRQS